MHLLGEEAREAVRRALQEDLGQGDVTSDGFLPKEASCRAEILAKERGVVCGLPVVQAVFREVSQEGLQPEWACKEGAVVEAGTTVLSVSGPAAQILAAERTALNFLQHLSGVATLTRRFVERIDGTGARLLDTRKTLAGLRSLEKYAVRCGGGGNHRVSLGDHVLVKDNHLSLLKAAYPNSWSKELGLRADRIRRLRPLVRVEVEAQSLEEVAELRSLPLDLLLLDNMSVEELQSAVQIVDGRMRLEASGGVSLENVRAIAQTGVDFISVGALTHSAKAMDFSLRVTIS
ncbi:carboxylating nicotinate-nucleotide diphosphorylase [Methylacidimicrobium tartarophylax]|uniref:Probable nicotinate-nucleotide pyrophosphorylase [carboxylating] n=1 Tax=Methylacidimicrobium tartarophylax TaxID=1041768 RepID=A0A5E6MFE9_9BACT|nr:carboxylating nicotinate-nucleotide diphosphorylase [Methylacidimicrobium tartarophylax]VVM04778.1 nicotinate-nucleotide pyrophosphorylase (carboxylating) [Methylacidimicrobium tartarophylax]